MKKILIILLVSLSFLSFKVDANNNAFCNLIKINEGNTKYCFKNYIIIEDYDKSEYLVYNKNIKLIKKLKFKWSPCESEWGSCYGPGIKFFETKYGNHIFIDYYVYYGVIDTAQGVVLTYLGINYDDDIIKYRNELGIYVDGKKIFDYATTKEKVKYRSFEKFADKNGFYLKDYLKYHIFGKKYDTGIYLSEKIRKRLDRFIKKIDEKKYDKEKILKKLEVLYKKFKNGKSYKSRFYTEVIIYLYSEITINKLKQQEKLEKISFYN